MKPVSVEGQGGGTEYFKTGLRAFVLKNFQVLYLENIFLSFLGFVALLMKVFSALNNVTEPLLGILLPFHFIKM